MIPAIRQTTKRRLKRIVRRKEKIKKGLDISVSVEVPLFAYILSKSLHVVSKKK